MEGGQQGPSRPPCAYKVHDERLHRAWRHREGRVRVWPELPGRPGEATCGPGAFSLQPCLVSQEAGLRVVCERGLGAGVEEVALRRRVASPGGRKAQGALMVHPKLSHGDLCEHDLDVHTAFALAEEGLPGSNHGGGMGQPAFAPSGPSRGQQARGSLRGAQGRGASHTE